MLQSGYLSKDKTFHFGDTNVKDIRGISPTNVINGEAVCRHIAVMLKDIYNAYGIEGNTLNVFQRDFSERENKGENILKILNEICEESKKTGGSKRSGGIIHVRSRNKGARFCIAGSEWRNT